MHMVSLIREGCLFSTLEKSVFFVISSDLDHVEYRSICTIKYQ
jgi:hypothetical protein